MGRPVVPGDDPFIPRLLVKLGRQQEAKGFLEVEFLQSMEILYSDRSRRYGKALEIMAKVPECAGLVGRAKETISAFFSNANPGNEIQYVFSEGSDYNNYSEVTLTCDNCWEVHLYPGGPLHFCLYCPESRFCDSCVERVRAGEPMERQPQDWEAVCSLVEHQFLQGPAKGWGGIEDGVMKFADREVQWTDWLGEVQEEWKAWAS